MFQKVGLVVYKYIGNIVVLFIHFHYNYLANTLYVLYIFLYSITDGSQTDIYKLNYGSKNRNDPNCSLGCYKGFDTYLSGTSGLLMTLKLYRSKAINCFV